MSSKLSLSKSYFGFGNNFSIIFLNLNLLALIVDSFQLACVILSWSFENILDWVEIMLWNEKVGILLNLIGNEILHFLRIIWHLCSKWIQSPETSFLLFVNELSNKIKIDQCRQRKKVIWFLNRNVPQKQRRSMTFHLSATSISTNNNRVYFLLLVFQLKTVE